MKKNEQEKVTFRRKDLKRRLGIPAGYPGIEWIWPYKLENEVSVVLKGGRTACEYTYAEFLTLLDLPLGTEIVSSEYKLTKISLWVKK